MSHIQAAQAKYNEATETYGRIKDILDLGESIPQEKKNELDTLFAAFDGMTADAKRLERAAEIEAKTREMNAPDTKSRLGAGGLGDEKSRTGATTGERKAFQRFLKVGERGLTGEEVKSLRGDSDSEGGFLKAPQEVAQQYVTFINDQVFIRELATVYPLDKAESLGVPTIETDIADSDWTSEVATGSEDTSLKPGKRELKPLPLAKRIKVTRTLLRQSVVNLEMLVMERLGYKFGVSQEKAFLTGTGANQPLGLFTASANGVSTGRDSIAASATVLTGDDFINAKMNLKAGYWNRPNTRWILGRSVVSTARKLKDTTNNYIWSPGLGPGGGLTGGLPQTLVEVPFAVSEYAPSTQTAGLYVGIIGDMSYYWIAEALALEIQVVQELYAETNQVGYIGRMEVDGLPVFEEAFSRMRML
jgi:HK97 family phage major capsid protein